MSAAAADTRRWVAAEALLALHRAGRGMGDTFTAPELAHWTAGRLSREQRVNASTRLCALGFVKHRVVVINGERVDTYRITPEGGAAIAEAGAGKVRKSGPKAGRAPNPVRPQALATRLWELVRMRRQVESETAALTLCDAGAQEFARVRATVARTLRRWELAGALQAGARRVRVDGQPVHSNGFKRYVLLPGFDTPEPPRWRPVLRQQAAGQGGQP